MKKLSLFLSLAGIAVLLIMFFLSSSQNFSPNNNKLLQNQKVSFSGLVIKEFRYPAYSFVILSNNLSFICNRCPSYLNQNISVLGFISNYNDKNSVIALKISLSSS